MLTSTLTVFRKIVLAASATLLLSGCLSHAPSSKLTEAPKTVAPEAIPSFSPQPYRLQIGDVMDVKLLLNPELNDQVTVRPDGMISTAAARDVMAYGRTPAELQQELEDLYADHLVNPRIAVILRSFAPTRIYVLGEVNQPGEFINVGPTLTLLQAVARAGGMKNTAGPDRLIILRRGAGDQPVAYSANYMKAAYGADPSSDVRLAPYDIVFVPRSDVGDVYLHFQQYIQQFLPVSFGINYQLNPADVD